MPGQDMYEALTKCERSRKTFIYDNIRCFAIGIIEAGFKTFVLLIAIRVFRASSTCKAVLSSAGFAGLLLAPIMVSLASRLKHTPSTKICMFYFTIVAMAIGVSVFANSFYTYFALIIISRIVFKQYIPIMVDVYGNNYDKSERGYKLSYALMVIPLATIVFSPICGRILDSNLDNYRVVLLIISLSAAVASYAFSKIPSRPIPETDNHSLLSNFKIITQDKLFFALLLIMTCKGVATQMTVPLRAEYLANEKYGLNISNFFVSLITVTIPYICRMASSILWGKLFDRLSLIQMIVAVSLFVLTGYILFFNSVSICMLSLSAAFTGIGYGGGEVVWCLWVTKIANKDKLSQYMSANAAFVGIRSFVSPFIGYILIGRGVSFHAIGNIAATLVLIAMLGCFAIKNHSGFSEKYD